MLTAPVSAPKAERRVAAVARDGRCPAESCVSKYSFRPSSILGSVIGLAGETITSGSGANAANCSVSTFTAAWPPPLHPARDEREAREAGHQRPHLHRLPP